MFFRGKTAPLPESHTARMKRRIDSAEGSGPVRPAIRHGRAGVWESLLNKGLTRFTLRGRAKVDGQWKLYCLVHNIEKLARHVYAQ